MSEESSTPSLTSKGPDPVRSGPGTLVIALAAVLLVALVACAWLLVDNRSKGSDLDAARAQAQELTAEQKADQGAVNAAKAFVGKVTTYSYEEGKHDFDWVKDLQNDKVRAQFEERVADLKAAIEKSKTSAKGEVVDAAGRVVDKTQVEVLAFVDQAITGPDGKVSVEESTIRLVMKLVDDTWRVDTLTFLNQVGS